MPINHDPLQKAFETIRDVEVPSEQQKEKMLHIVLAQAHQNETTLREKIGRFVSLYPWRVAFGISSLQAVAFTLIFGTRYTNIFLHYGYEKRKFDAEWTRLEQEYRAAGMDDRQIAAMKEYDWTWFCSQRTYQNRVQALPSEQCEDESEQSCLFRKFESLSCTWDTGDVDSRRFGWLSSLEDELLYRRLCKLPEDDLELLTLLIVDGYRQADVARLWNCSRSAITQRINKIKIFLKKA